MSTTDDSYIKEEAEKKHKKLHDIVETLIQKYSTNEYVEGKLVNFIENMLPTALENAHNTLVMRSERKQQLTAHKDDFTQRFLLKHKYFYLPHAETFVHYDNLHFSVYSEDDIQHQILSSISQEHSLRVWKHKIKNNIMKQIKELSPLKAQPEEVTIQRVISYLFPAFFETHAQAKYFLTVLGECLTQGLQGTGGTQGTGDTHGTLVSNTDIPPAGPCTYIISPQLKALVKEINNQGYLLFGPLATFSNIKFKHYDHEYKCCRLLYGAKKGAITPLIVKNILDILCVSAYFATRYGSADKFLAQCNDTKLCEYALLLHKTTPAGLVQRFVDKTLTSCMGTNIEFKHMLFIWKKFLGEHNIPNVLFYESLKQHLMNAFWYDTENDCFLNVTSTYLPVVASFIKFWENSVTEDEDEELELHELFSLFKSVSSKNNASVMTEALLLDLVRHFYPDTLVLEEKIFLNIKCGFMDKKKYILQALEHFKGQVLAHTTPSAIFTLDTVYDAYTLFTANTLSNILPKRYFEKVARDFFDLSLDADGIINPDYWVTPTS
jgi:hypothetical protein